MGTPITYTIRPEEPCYRLAEVNLLTPDYRELHRFQIVYVIRNDALAMWKHDLGPAKNFTATEVQIPGAVETAKGMEIVETVERLQGYAKEHRARGASGTVEVPDLMLAYRKQVERELDGAASN